MERPRMVWRHLKRWSREPLLWVRQSRVGASAAAIHVTVPQLPSPSAAAFGGFSKCASSHRPLLVLSTKSNKYASVFV